MKVAVALWLLAVASLAVMSFVLIGLDHLTYITGSA